MISTVFGIWMLHIVLTLIYASPVLFFGRRRAKWQPRDLLALIVPFSIWLCLMFTPLAHGKTLGNALVEGLWISGAIVVAAVVRIWIPHALLQWRYFVLVLAAICAVGVVAFFVTPPLPE